MRGVRVASADVEPWLPDLGLGVDLAAEPFARSRALGADDGFVLLQEGQLVVVRDHGITRVARPSGLEAVIVGASVALLGSESAGAELVVLPLPPSGEHDLTLQPVGEAVEASEPEPAVVAFAGTATPTLIVQHPKYGRLTFMREAGSAPPPVGARILLDGVEVDPDRATVRVSRWWLEGARSARRERVLSLGPAQRSAFPPKLGSPPILASLTARAHDAQLPVPEELRPLLERVERDAHLRACFANVGFVFDERELGLDVLRAHGVDGFVPVWGNGYDDGFGGITRAGLAIVRPMDDPAPSPIASLEAHIRATIDDLRDDDGPDASVDAIAKFLDEGGL